MGISAVIAAGVLGAGAGMYMSNKANKQIQMPDEAPPPPQNSPADMKMADEAQRKGRRKGGGRSSTILTGPRGLGDTPSYSGKTMLGE